MGFRVPLTSARAVDTGDTAGVRIFGNAANPGQGVVRWYVGGNTADATLSGSQTGSGGASWSAALTSGATGGGPRLALNVESAPTGGYTPVVRVTGAATVDLGGADLVNLAGSGWLSPVLAAGFTVSGDCYVMRRAGWAAVVLTVLASAGWAANTPVLAVPLSAGIRPQKTAWVPGNVSGSGTFALTKFDPNGQITIIPAASGSQDFRVAYTYPTI